MEHEHEKEAFDVTGFLDLLAEVMQHHGTGLVSVRIHVADGAPWAVSIEFDNAGKRAA